MSTFRQFSTIAAFCLCIAALNTTMAQTRQDYTTFKVDRSVKDTVDKLTTLTDGFATGQMKIRLFVNDSLFFDTYDKDENLEFFTMTFIEKDTIQIIGFFGMFVGFGFYLDLFKGGCSITHLVKSDAEIYKINKSDTSLTYKLSVPCSERKLTLVNKPTFRKGEIIQGIIELTSQDYWEVANGHENKYRVQLKAYFKATEMKQKKQKQRKQQNDTPEIIVVEEE